MLLNPNATNVFMLLNQCITISLESKKVLGKYFHLCKKYWGNLNVQKKDITSCMVVHTCDSPTLETERKEGFRFKANTSYMVTPYVSSNT